MPEGKIIYAEDFHQASDDHMRQNIGCKDGSFLYSGDKMVCQCCGQVWRKPSAIRDVYRNMDMRRQTQVE